MPETYLQTSGYVGKKLKNQLVFAETTVNQIFCYLQSYAFLME